QALAFSLFSQAAAMWEAQLGSPESALLRYREALAQEPGPEDRRAMLAAVARISGSLGLQADALAAQREVARLSQGGRARAEAFLIEARLLARMSESNAE